MAVTDNRAEVAGVEVFWREAPVADGRVPTLYVHGVPTSSDDWLPFLERTGGIAPDLPGFGRSGKPAHFDYSIEGFTDALGQLLAQQGIERYSLVVHDWGGAALGLAQREPDRLHKLVVINCVPLLPGYHWHRIARIWRTPLLGELFMGVSTRWGLKQLSREATAAPGPAPDDFIDAAWQHFDHGTQRAILKLYRSAPESVLARAGERLGDVRCQALVLWGEDDPYIDPSFGKRFADELGGDTRLEILPGVRHYPWIDEPRSIETVVDFLLS